VDADLFYSRLQAAHCTMDCDKFEFNDIISLYTKTDSEIGGGLSVWIFYIVKNTNSSQFFIRFYVDKKSVRN